jgi:hypothetical protein
VGGGALEATGSGAVAVGAADALGAADAFGDAVGATLADAEALAAACSDS